MDALGLIAGFVLTLMVFSYLLGDNILYRLAVYVLVGLTAGYITIVTVESVLVPWFRSTVGSGNAISLGVGLLPVMLATFLLLKSSSRLGQLGNLALAIIIGIGAAIAMVGAVTGTLFPLVSSTGNAQQGNVLNTVIVFVGVISTLLYFQFLARRTPAGKVERSRLMQPISFIGQGFIIVTFAALYAAAILTSLTIFTERISFMLTQFTGR